MTEEQLNNIDNPLPLDTPYTPSDAIQAINRLLWADGVQGDDYADAMVVKSFLAVFLDSASDEMAVMTSAYNSLHDRYGQALAEIEQLKAQGKIDKATINASISSINAANDNR